MHCMHACVLCVWHNRTCWKLASQKEADSQLRGVALKAYIWRKLWTRPGRTDDDEADRASQVPVLDSETNRHYTTTIEQADSSSQEFPPLPRPRIYFLL